MSEEFDPNNVDEKLAQGPQSSLEKRFIDAYLHGKGYRFEDLKKLPEEQAKQLMCEACKYASLKLAEVESRAQFRERIRSSSS
jgi:hypothetical protein